MVEWRIEYFREPSGRVPVQEFIDRLTGEEQIETMIGIDMLRTHSLSLGRPWVAPLGKSLWELRIRSRRQLRVLYLPILERRLFASRFREEDPPSASGGN